jgi:hypothetical protein
MILLIFFFIDVEINKSDLSTQLSTTESVINSFLPTCNRSASNVKDVYNIYDIIPKSKLETLYEHVVEILNGKIEGYVYIYISFFFLFSFKDIKIF